MRAISAVVCTVVVAVAVTLAANTAKPSRTTFSSSVRQLVVGDSVTLKAAVSAVSANDGTPTGTVEFFDGATSLGSVQLAAAQSGIEGSLTLNNLGVGPHPISVRYSGDSTFGGSVSAPEFVIVLAQ